MRTEGQTDTKLIFSFRNSAKAPKKLDLITRETQTILRYKALNNSRKQNCLLLDTVEPLITDTLINEHLQ
jgi:hypothetical protein